jgi:tetratricopeptide (TPR) repeat protein
MMTQGFTRSWIAVAACLAVIAVARPVYAQGNGSLRGKVVNADGRAVDRVEIVLELVGTPPRQVRTVTDKNGEWIRTGLPHGSVWTVTARQFKLSGKAAANVTIKGGETLAVPDIVISEGGADKPAAATPAPNPTNLSAEEAKKRNEKSARLQALLKEANAAIEAKNYDEALSKLETLATEVEGGCPACYARMGDILVGKNDLPAAEKAYLKAIELDANDPGPYRSLAGVYNSQRKFDEAIKMSSKANELSTAAGGGGSATDFLNQGITLWNAGKAPEARDAFAQAVKLDPKLADAHFRLGLAIFSLTAGTPEAAQAKGPLEEYLKLAPTGEHAETAKGILATIK